MSAPQRRRRLRHVASCIGASITPISANPELNHQALLPLPLDVAGGGVGAEKLEELRERKRLALEAEDYRLAAEMSDLLRVLGSGGVGVSVADAAACRDTDEREAFMLRYGFCVLPAVFTGDHLHRLRDAWRRVQRPYKEKWLGLDDRAEDGRGAQQSRFFDLPVPIMYSGLTQQLAVGDRSPADAVLLDRTHLQAIYHRCV